MMLNEDLLERRGEVCVFTSSFPNHTGIVNQTQTTKLVKDINSPSRGGYGFSNM